MEEIKYNNENMFKEYNQGQDFLLPPSFRDYLGEGHEAIILSEIIEELNLEKLLKQYNKNITGNGRPAYNPKMLLKVLFYGYMNQTFSSRKLANKTKSDLGFMYLTGNNKPDFRTINRFRTEKGNILEDIFVQIVKKSCELGIINFGTVSLDGTKIYANASKNKNYDLTGLEKKIKGFFDEAEKIDELENEEFGEENENHIPEELKTKAGRDKKRKELEEKKQKAEAQKEMVKNEINEKEKAGIKQDRINLTDTDSRLVLMKRKDYANGYNPQILTENQIILTTTVSNSADDSNELITILEKLKEKFTLFPRKILADKGYGNEKNYKYLEDKKIVGYIPHSENSGKSLQDYIYDKNSDIYTDKDGNIFTFKQYVGKIDGTGKRGRPKKEEQDKQKEENYKAKLYVTKLKSGENKFLYIAKRLKETYQRNDERLYSQEGKEIYKKRGICVEPVFGNVKFNLGFERFLLRGFEGVQIEWNLISLAHNLKKLIKFRLS